MNKLKTCATTLGIATVLILSAVMIAAFLLEEENP